MLKGNIYVYIYLPVKIVAEWPVSLLPLISIFILGP